MIADRYPIRVFWSDEDQGFIAVAPDFPGSSAWGRTGEEAVRELGVVIEGWLEIAEECGQPAPAPSRDQALEVAA